MDLNHGDIEMSDDEPAAAQQTLNDALKRIEELEAALSATQQEGLTQAQAHQTELSAVREELAQSTAVSNDLQSQVAALGPQVAAAIDAVDSNATITALREEITSLRRENKAYMANRVTMEAQIQALEDAVGNEGGQDLVAMTDDRDRMQRDRDEFYHQIQGENNPDSFVRVVQRLRDQIDVQIDAQALQERNTLLEEQIETVEADLAALPTAAQWTTAQQQLQEYEELKLEHTDSQLLVESLERQLKDSKLDLAKAHLALAQTSDGQVQTEQSSQSQTPEAQNAELLLQVRTLEVRIAEQDVEITNLRATQGELEREAVRTQWNLQQEMERAQGLEQTIQSRNQRIAELEQGEEDLREVMQSGVEEEGRLQTRITHLEIQVTLVQESLDDLGSEHDELRTEYDALVAHNNALAQNDPILVQAIQENQVLRDQLESGAVENGVQDELNEALEANITLEERIEQLEAIITKVIPNRPLSHSMAETIAAMAETIAGVEALRIPIDQLNARVAELTAENETLQGLVNAAQQSNDQSDEKANHEKQIQQLRDHCAQEKEDLRAEIERLQNTLEKPSTDCMSEMAALNARLAEALAQVTELTTERTDCAHQNEHLEQQLLAARASLQVSEDALEKALSNLASCEENNESGEAHEGLLQCQAEVERLETALANANGELADVQAQLQLARESVNYLQGRVQSQESQINSFEAQIQEQDQALQQAQEDLFDCRQAHADNQGVLKIWGERLHAYEEADKERARKIENSEAAPLDDEALKKLHADLTTCRQETALKEAAHGQALLEIGAELAACRQQHTEDQNALQEYQNRLEKMKRADNNIIDSMEEELNKALQDLAACREQLTKGPSDNGLQGVLDKTQEDLTKSSIHNTEQQKTIQGLKERVAQLEHELEAHQEPQNADHDQALAKAQEDLAACLQQHEEDLKIIQDFEWEKQLEEIQQQQAADEEPTQSDLEKALNAAEEGLEACREQRAKDQNTYQELVNENRVLQNARDGLHQTLADVRGKAAEDKKTIEDLQAQINSIEDSEDEQTVYEEALNEARGKLALCFEQHKIDESMVYTLNERIEGYLAMLKEAVSREEALNARLEEQSRELEALRERLETALAAAQATGTDGSNATIKSLEQRIRRLERELQNCTTTRNEMQEVLNDFREQSIEDKRTIVTLTRQSLEADERERRLEDELEVVRQNLLNETALHTSLQTAATMAGGEANADQVAGFDAQIVGLMNKVATSEEFRLDIQNQLYALKLNPNATEQEQAARISELENENVNLRYLRDFLEHTIRGLEQARKVAETEADQLRAQLPPQPTATGNDKPEPKPTPPHPRLILRSGRTYRRVPQPAPTQRNTTAPRPLYTGLPTGTGGIRKRPSTKKKGDKK